MLCLRRYVTGVQVSGGCIAHGAALIWGALFPGVFVRAALVRRSGWMPPRRLVAAVPREVAGMGKGLARGVGAHRCVQGKAAAVPRGSRCVVGEGVGEGAGTRGWMPPRQLAAAVPRGLRSAVGGFVRRHPNTFPINPASSSSSAELTCPSCLFSGPYRRTAPSTGLR